MIGRMRAGRTSGVSMRRFLIPILGVVFVGVGLRCSCQKTPAGTDAGPDASLAGADGSVTSDSGGPFTSVDAGESVLMHHKTLDRNGMYIQPALKKTAISTFNKDPNFNVTLPDPNDNVYAQPLYVDRAAAGKADLVIVATEADNVYALDSTTGAQVWVQDLGTPVPLSALPCGNIDPVGITGTPVIDPGTNSLFVAAEVLVNPDG